MHGPAGTTGGADVAGLDGRPTEELKLHELFDLNIYWLAINLLWGALGIALLPILMIDLVCHGNEACSDLTPIVGGVTVSKGVAEAIIVNLGALVAILVQPTVAAISDHWSSRIGRRKPFIVVGTLFDMVFLIGLYLAGAWAGVLLFYVLLQFSSNFAQGPFQGFMPDLVPARQVALASGLMGLMILLGVGGGAMLVALFNNVFHNPRGVVFVVMATEFITMVITVVRVRDGRQGIPRGDRSWLRVGLSAWGTDILREHSYMWLLGSRLFLLMTSGSLIAIAFYYMQDSFGLSRSDALNLTFVASALVIVFGAIATVPSGLISRRLGKKRTIYIAALIGFIGMSMLVWSPSPSISLVFVVLVGVGSGAFLAVDWALMTDIIPKAESGRYMGISNVVTGASGAFAAAIGLTIVDVGNHAVRNGAGPRLAYLVTASFYVVGCLLLTRVDERRREDEPAIAASEVAPVPIAPAAS